MQYAPAVTDRSAEIYAQGANNATNIRAQGQANFQNSLTSSFNTAMGMVNKRIEKNETDNAKMQQSMASGQAMMSLSDNYGEQGQKFKMSLGKALEDTKGNPNKMSGAVMAHAAEFENMQKQQTAQKTYAALGNAYAGKAAATAAAKAAQPAKLDANYGRQFYQVLIQQGKMTHEQALAEMDKAGLGYARQYIEKQENPFWK